jgi:hypothetical protein
MEPVIDLTCSLQSTSLYDRRTPGGDELHLVSGDM